MKDLYKGTRVTFKCVKKGKRKCRFGGEIDDSYLEILYVQSQYISHSNKSWRCKIKTHHTRINSRVCWSKWDSSERGPRKKRVTTVKIEDDVPKGKDEGKTARKTGLQGNTYSPLSLPPALWLAFFCWSLKL